MSKPRMIPPDRLMLIFLLALFGVLVPFVIVSGDLGIGLVVRLTALYAMLVAGAVFLGNLLKRVGFLELKTKFLEVEVKRRSRGPRGADSTGNKRRPNSSTNPSEQRTKN